MSDRQALLPRNATAFETSISLAMDRSPELSIGVDALRGFKFNPTDQIVPFLITEFGLSEISEYLPDQRQLLREGIQWQRIVGTPASIHKALSWINYDGDIEEFLPTKRKWWWFQVHLPFEVRNTDFVTPMTRLVTASKPLRSEFARVTSGWDVRAFILNKHRLNGDAYLNDWSGIRPHPDEPVLSFRAHERDVVVVPFDGTFPVLQTQTIHMFQLVNADIPLFNPDYRLAAAAAERTNYQNPATVPFQNAPFVNSRFGVPVPRVQIGFE